MSFWKTVSLHNIKEHTSSLQPLISFVTADGTWLPILDVACGTAVCCEVVVKVEEELIPARPDPPLPTTGSEISETEHFMPTRASWFGCPPPWAVLFCSPRKSTIAFQRGQCMFFSREKNGQRRFKTPSNYRDGCHTPWTSECPECWSISSTGSKMHHWHHNAAVGFEL